MINCNIDYAYNVSNKIEDLELACFGKSIKKIYDTDKNIKVLYKMEANKMIAFLTFKREEQAIEIYNLAVDETVRRTGIGSELLNSIHEFDLSLEVRESNKQAIAFYLNNGFDYSYRRKNYYPGEDALVLERMRFASQNAYAKVNLILNVLNKREDGFHEIEFLMNTLNICDVVKVRKAIEDDVRVTNREDLNGLDNLAYKALLELRNEYGFKTKYAIEIEKNIPVAAGMAGGSSDAAAVLRIINQLENLGLSKQKLAEIGSRVGSDVSFCVYSQLAIARGRGEKIELVKKLIPSKYVLVVNPGVPLSTPSVYKNHVVDSERGKIDNLLNAINHKEFEANLHNSLMSTAIDLCPETKLLIDQLTNDTEHRVLVSGSGPTVLVFSEDEEEVDKLYTKYSELYSLTYKALMD